jgi:hypothetical protein
MQALEATSKGKGKGKGKKGAGKQAIALHVLPCFCIASELRIADLFCFVRSVVRSFVCW